ncbi:hypothetical protein D3C78_1575970 [compost metagenome]
MSNMGSRLLNTSCEAALSIMQMMIRLLALMASLASRARLAPSCSRVVARSGLRFQTVTPYPACSNVRASTLPMAPRPRTLTQGLFDPDVDMICPQDSRGWRRSKPRAQFQKIGAWRHDLQRLARRVEPDVIGDFLVVDLPQARQAV